MLRMAAISARAFGAVAFTGNAGGIGKIR